MVRLVVRLVVRMAERLGTRWAVRWAAGWAEPTVLPLAARWARQLLEKTVGLALNRRATGRFVARETAFGRPRMGWFAPRDAWAQLEPFDNADTSNNSTAASWLRRVLGGILAGIFSRVRVSGVLWSFGLIAFLLFHRLFGFGFLRRIFDLLFQI